MQLCHPKLVFVQILIKNIFLDFYHFVFFYFSPHPFSNLKLSKNCLCYRVQNDRQNRSGNKHFRGTELTEVTNKKLFKNIFRNSLLIFPTGLFYVLPLHLYTRFHLDGGRQMPHPRDMTWHMLFTAVVVNEILFFYGHWLMHANKWLYKNVHKIHHEYTCRKKHQIIK